jgi:L-lactate dehydrogenase complex protein LldG
MKASKAKENILKNIRQALAQPVPVPFPQSEGASSVFVPLQNELEVEFAENFTGLQGKFSYCENEKELAVQLKTLVEAKNLKAVYCRENRLKETLSNYGFTGVSSSNDLHQCDAAITECDFLVARTGSIALSSGQQSGRTVSVYAPVHICVAYTNQLVYDTKEGLQKMKEKYAGKLPSFITFAAGPSRTADIEKTLVVGVHGPREVFLFLVEQSEVDGK